MLNWLNRKNSRKKEEETQRLADQFKSQKDASSQAEKQENAIPVTVTAAADTVNGFTVENTLSDSEPISIAFQCAAQMSVTVYVNGTQNTSHTFDQSWTYTFQSGTDTLIELEISGYQANDQITVNNTAVPLQETGFTDGYGVVTLQFTGSANQSSQDQSSDQSQEPDQLNTEQTPTQEDYSQSEEYVESGQESSIRKIRELRIHMLLVLIQIQTVNITNKNVFLEIKT